MMGLASLIAGDLRGRSPRCRQTAARRARSRAPASISAISRCRLASSAALDTPVGQYWLARVRALMSSTLRVIGQPYQLLGEEGADRAHLRDHRVGRSELAQVVGLDLVHAPVEREAIAIEAVYAGLQRTGAVADHAVVAESGFQRAGQRL